MRADLPESELDRLYRLPLAEFTAARNDLARRLRAAGERDASAVVKALPKPSAPAWAVNQLYWTQRPLWDALLAAGERLRAAQHATLAGQAGADLAGALGGRREAVAAALRAAAGILAGGGAASSAGTERRLTATLEALAAGMGRDVAPGRLTAELEPPGFDAVTALAAEPRVAPTAGRSCEGRDASGAAPDPAAADARAATRAGQRARARDAVTGAESELARSRRVAAHAASAVEVATVRADAAASEVEESERRLARARERAGQARHAAREAERSADAAREAADRAERALAETRADLAAAKEE